MENLGAFVMKGLVIFLCGKGYNLSTAASTVQHAGKCIQEMTSSLETKQVVLLKYSFLHCQVMLRLPHFWQTFCHLSTLSSENENFNLELKRQIQMFQACTLL